MYDDLDRPPLNGRSLARGLVADGWRVEVVTTTTSTNALVGERARGGEPAGLVVVAEQQTAGRGRLDRSWISPPRAGLTFSVLLRPDLPLSRWGWLPLLAGVAVVRALRAQAQVEATLKWPNDVLIEDRKVCGLLAESVLTGGPDPQGALVLGVGLNVTTRAEELPPGQATSLRLQGARTTDRDTLLRAILREISTTQDDPDAARADYRAMCSTLGRRVRITLAYGAEAGVEGAAQDIDSEGRLVVDGTAYGAGDVVHLRPVSP